MEVKRAGTAVRRAMLPAVLIAFVLFGGGCGGGGGGGGSEIGGGQSDATAPVVALTPPLPKELA